MVLSVYNNRFKVVLLGDSGVGKSTLLLQFSGDAFRPLQATIGIDYRKCRMLVENEEIILDIWDTGGQERFRSLTQNHFRDTQGVVLMYSVDTESSFESISRWLSDVERYCHPDTRILIIGNKCDVADRVVPVEHGLKLSNQLGAPFMESSAKNDVNVKTTFHLLAKMMLDERRVALKSNKMQVQLFDERILRLENNDCCQHSFEESFRSCCTMQ